jgi:protein N-lysine methyltransferase METTL21D
LLEQLQGASKATLFHQNISEAHVLELGGGTGLLSLIIGSRVKSYTCTDLPELIPLINKNIFLNRDLVPGHEERLLVEALDWKDVENCPQALRRRLLSHIYRNCPQDVEGNTGFDLVLAVDCIYNPSLVPPLLATIDHFAISNQSVIMIVMELRDESVVREFLTQWLAMTGWEIRQVGNDNHSSLLDERFVVWVGRKMNIII